MSELRKKLSEYGLGIQPWFGKKDDQNFHILIDDLLKQGEGKMNLPELMKQNLFIKMEIQDVNQFKKAFHLPPSMQQLDDLIFNRMTVRIREENKIYLKLDDFPNVIKRELIMKVAANDSWHEKHNKAYALKKTFQPGRALKELVDEQMEITKKLICSQEMAAQFETFRLELIQISE